MLSQPLLKCNPPFQELFHHCEIILGETLRECKSQRIVYIQQMRIFPINLIALLRKQSYHLDLPSGQSCQENLEKRPIYR